MFCPLGFSKEWCSLIVMVHRCNALYKIFKMKVVVMFMRMCSRAGAPLKPICFPQIRLTLLISFYLSLLILLILCSTLLQNFPPLKKTCSTLLITNLHLPQCIPTLSWPHISQPILSTFSTSRSKHFCSGEATKNVHISFLTNPPSHPFKIINLLTHKKLNKGPDPHN